ncbi:MAG: hypothetical protein M3367_12360 [Acidobacteriota bacterium]|nr:hypothetical protein [Acidobacteriota bacterium]
MKNNRIIWGLVALVVLTTIAISLGTTSSHSQQETSKKQDNKQNDTGFRDLSKYAVLDYDAPEPDNAVEREKRILKNKRYDKQGLVVKNPHPDDGGVSVEDEIPPPPIIPAAESDLIVIGEIVNASAHLSNDKSGIYTEFTIRVDETLKSDTANKVEQDDSITADRTGGVVRYPNGQKVFYRNDGDDLPRVGSKYVLFLTSDKQSPNYKILNGQELKDDGVIPLDLERSFDAFKGARKMSFIKAVRDKIAESSTGEGLRRKP